MTHIPTAAARASGRIKTPEMLARRLLQDLITAVEDDMAADAQDAEHTGALLDMCDYAVVVPYETANTILAAIHPDPEPVNVAFGRQHFEPKRDSDHQPWDATPSSAGTVSVEAAARNVVRLWDNGCHDISWRQHFDGAVDDLRALTEDTI